MRVRLGGCRAPSFEPLSRGVLLVAATAVACLASVAETGASTAASGRAAASGGVTPVIGGSGFADAPLLGGPGVYSDTLLPRETLFYAVSLRAGERLRVRMTVDVSVSTRSTQDFPDAGAAFSAVALYTPLRQRLYTENLGEGGDFESEVIEINGPRVLPAAAAGRRAARNESWTGPGIYHLAIVLSKLTRSLGATVELPVRLAIEVERPPGAGAPVGSVSPGPLGDPRTGPRVSAAAARVPDRRLRQPVSIPLTVAGAAGGLVAGAAIGFGTAVRRRRTS